MALELHPWRFELEIFQSLLVVSEPKLNAQQCVICEVFCCCCCSQNVLSRAHCGVLVPTTSLWLGLIDSLPFATVIFWLHF